MEYMVKKLEELYVDYKDLVEEYENLFYADKERFCEKLHLTNKEEFEEELDELRERDIMNMSNDEVMNEVHDRFLDREFITDCDDYDIIKGFFWNESYKDKHFKEIDKEKLIELKEEIEKILEEKRKNE